MSNYNSILDRIARIKAQRAQALSQLKSVPLVSEANPISEKITQELSDLLPTESQKIQTAGITYNPQQQDAIDRAFNGETFCLSGPAGTGKTTTTNGLILKLLSNPQIGRFSFSTKYLLSGKPSIVLTAFTKRATKNAEEAINNPQISCFNFHKLLEYQPVFYEDYDDKGELVKTMRFEPKYNNLNKLPHIETILIEEVSQFSIEMFKLLIDALPRPKSTQFILIGDIQQIPPAMGKSIYGPLLISEPAVELTRVYRQALESPIIRFLTDMRGGKPITRNDWKKYTRDQSGNRNNKLNMGIFPPNLDWEEALHQAISFLRDQFSEGIYNPYTDMVLVPFNIKFGTIALNREIAHFLDVKENRLIYPIISGFNKKHLAVGDYVLCNTEDFVIEEIRPNPKYTGKSPKPPSKYIDREGSVFNRDAYIDEQSISDRIFDLESNEYVDPDSEDSQRFSLENIDDFVKRQLEESKNDEKFNSASHILKLRSLDDSEISQEISSCGDLNKLILSYAITVHKAQGLQANRVYFFLHNSHSPMHFRELIYTAASRAKEYLTIICDPKFLERGIKNQRIPGTNLEEKITHLKTVFDPKEIQDVVGLIK